MDPSALSLGNVLPEGANVEVGKGYQHKTVVRQKVNSTSYQDKIIDMSQPAISQKRQKKGSGTGIESASSSVSDEESESSGSESENPPVDGAKKNRASKKKDKIKRKSGNKKKKRKRKKEKKLGKTTTKVHSTSSDSSGDDNDSGDEQNFSLLFEQRRELGPVLMKLPAMVEFRKLIDQAL